MPKNQTAELGDKVKDYITGFEGILTSVIDYLYGCKRGSIEGTDKDGKPTTEYFDLQRLEVVEKRKVENHAPKVTSGGDRPNPPARR